jgi:hypothetical protein
VVSALSQFIGLVQIVLLTRNGGAGRGSDAYFFLFSMALLPIQILLAGLLYPLLLNQTGTTTRTLRRLRLLTPWACVMMVMVGALWLWHLGKLTPSIYGLVALCAINGFVSAKLWYHSLELAADGEAIWLAGVALPANVLACLFIVNAWSPSTARATIMVGGLLVGNIALLTYLTMTGRTRPINHPQKMDPTTSTRKSGGWFLAKAVTGYASQDILEALALLLPAASLTILNVINRIVGSISTTVVSSILPKLVNRQSTSRANIATFTRWLAIILVLPFCVVGATALVIHLPYQEYVFTTLAWLLTSGMNVSAQRMAYRFLAPSASVLSIVSAVLVIGFLVFASTTPWFTLKVLFVGAIALDALPAAFLLWTLSERAMSVVTFLVFLGAGGLLFGGAQ